MRLLLDEHLSPRIAVRLRASGHDVVAVAERADLRGRGDAALVDVAAVEGRAMVTFDVIDHLQLLGAAIRLGRDHPGLVLLAPARWSPSLDGIDRLVGALGALLAEHPEPGDLRGRLVWLQEQPTD